MFAMRRRAQARRDMEEAGLLWGIQNHADERPLPPPPFIEPDPCQLEEDRKLSVSSKVDTSHSEVVPLTEPEPASSKEGMDLKGLCKVCMDKKVETVFIPCGHRVVCVECSRRLQNCCLCRKKITLVVKTWDT